MLLRRLALSALIAALIAPNAPLFAAQAATGIISGTAHSASSQTMTNTTVRLRNVQTGQLAGETTSNAAGQFSFPALGPGNYVVEVVNAAGQVVGTSATISLTAAAMAATGVAVTASAAGAVASAGAGGAFLASTWGIVAIAAAGAGVVGVVAAETRSNASPSE